MIRLSASAFDVVWADLGLGRVPEPLRVRSVGHTDAERADIRAAVYANLAERGLLPGGELDEAVVARLTTLASASVFVECEALADMDSDEPLRAVAAGDGSRAVLAVQPSQTVGLSAIRPGELCPAIVDLLPELPPGPGYGVNLPATELPSPDGASAARQRQLREVLAIQARPVYSAGQLTVRVRENGTVARRGGLTWFLTDVGAYFGTVAAGRGGQDWLTAGPVDAPRLTQQLADLVAP
ncbi:ESX secretion-associated protein EspG [Amycolatopsis suaedae]|uniref:ESX secretion-associated protein EspG n=1 Tax=Amycolatopsis suaedae TaxID=2510978 RepID=A0A4Q7J1R8_9PSEU|nr:ESX secretion-associated protein EspG [Amycolatopsis suaedae]RZQ59874.1 ESX secretion-associated protein EspG [Amycolatopsis suaedae]